MRALVSSMSSANQSLRADKLWNFADLVFSWFANIGYTDALPFFILLIAQLFDSCVFCQTPAQTCEGEQSEFCAFPASRFESDELRHGN